MDKLIRKANIWDLHIHTPLGTPTKKNYGGVSNEEFVDSIIDIYKEASNKIGMISFTDHNVINVDAYELFRKKSDISIIPGIEVDIFLSEDDNDSKHILFYFDEKELDTINGLKELIEGYIESKKRVIFEDFIMLLISEGKRFAVSPHAFKQGKRGIDYEWFDEKKAERGTREFTGLFFPFWEAQGKTDICKAIEFLKTQYNEKSNTQAVIAFSDSSDYKKIKDYIDRPHQYFQCLNSFKGLLLAGSDPERIIYEMEKRPRSNPSEKIKEIRLSNNLHRINKNNAIKLELSDRLNVIVGGRGKGKSALLDAIVSSMNENEIKDRTRRDFVKKFYVEITNFNNTQMPQNTKFLYFSQSYINELFDGESQSKLEKFFEDEFSHNNDINDGISDLHEKVEKGNNGGYIQDININDDFLNLVVLQEEAVHLQIRKIKEKPSIALLFVSEKLAALSVVYDKLKQAGLEEFCLELHSYKSSKKEVIAELCKTLRADRSVVSARADAEVQTKAKLQKQLDDYAEELHKPIPGINKSLYQLYEAHSAHRQATELDLPINDIEKKDENYLNEAVNLLSQYEDYIPTIGEDYKKNEWYGYKSQNGSYEAQNKLKQDLQIVINGLGDFIPKANACKEEYSLDLDTLFGADRYIQMLNVLSATEFLKPSMLTKEKVNITLNSTKNLKELSDHVITIREYLNDIFEESVYKIDGQDYYNKMTKLYSGSFSRLFNAEYKSMISDIRLASKTGKKPSYDTATEYMKSLSDYQDFMNRFDEEKKNIQGLLDQDKISVDTDWARLNTELDIVKTCFDNDLTAGRITSMSDDEFDLAKARFGEQANIMAGSINTFKQPLLDLQRDFDSSVEFETMPLYELSAKIQRCMNSIDKVENWVRFYTLLKQLEDRDLLSFVDCAIENNVSKDQIADSYQRLFFKQWINHDIYEKPVIAGFTRISQDKIVEQFAQKDRLQFEISKAQIKAELSAKRPSLDMMAGGSAVSILLREGEKKRKQKSIRKLLEETGDLVQLIKPCFLMSPLSVSTFLSENSITFDTVVFDEASQIFPQDAIGAIYRAKQLIVVGDSKQMPPSNFFSSSVDIDDNDEETGDVTDFESILDLCSTTLPQLRLRWHYRSKFEQLITFSNRNFYDNSLVTFPSSTTDRNGVGVDYYHVDGLFDRKSHTNRKEAEYIVDLIYKNIDTYPNRSLGVVAFSVAQQDLIDRLLSKRRQADSSKEWFFKRDDDKKEPFFIKNLETVQGDERDTIIFSVAYGMDEQGRLLHNFGPLNRVGGERRLNVAVTRAKDNVQLVSSMHCTDIDLSRTSAEGARLLREYLDYAENGDIALERTISVNPFEQFDSEFEMDVCDFLREHGFTVDMQVGCSGFRIDIGLKKPDSSDYVLAIECDGATYHSSKNARDRDRLRQEILERMGWRFYRIWSTDWFRNTTVEKERLLKAATEAVHLGPYEKKEEPQEEEEEEIEFEQTIAPKHLAFPEFKEADIYGIWRASYRSRINLIKRIVDVEAPVSEEYLLKRICFAYNRKMVSSVVRDEYEFDMRSCRGLGMIRKRGFIYKADQDSYTLRVPGDKREIKYIAPEELAAGLMILLKQNVRAEKEGLYRALVNQLGFNRLGDASYERLDEALRFLSDKVIVEGNIISIR